jgi:cytochrome c-type biogenesis protein CcmH/NrfF
MRKLPEALLLAVGLLGAASAWGAEREEVLGVGARQSALKVIDEKCLVCHNRQRIDAAAREQKDMEKIVRQMEQKGVTLTDKDRQVLNHFWNKTPFKGDAGK